jgi:hypothetical protein
VIRVIVCCVTVIVRSCQQLPLIVRMISRRALVLTSRLPSVVLMLQVTARTRAPGGLVHRAGAT